MNDEKLLVYNKMLDGKMEPSEITKDVIDAVATEAVKLVYEEYRDFIKGDQILSVMLETWKLAASKLEELL